MPDVNPTTVMVDMLLRVVMLEFVRAAVWGVVIYIAIKQAVRGDRNALL